MIDKKFLVNSAKATTAWALSTAAMAAPVSLLGSNPGQSYMFGCAALGAYVPLLLLIGTRFRGARDVAGLYIVLYNGMRERVRNMINRASSKIK